MRRRTTIETSLGTLTLLGEGGALTGLYFPGHWVRPPLRSTDEVVPSGADPLFGEVASQLDGYLSGERRGFDLPLRARGEAFEEKVWALLVEIPYGETTTYGALAERLGDRALARRVGQAVGRNPLSVIVPCHRVVGKDGKLTGYAGGLERKAFLLALEQPAGGRAGRLF